MVKHDAIIVGAGPGGLIVAEYLAKNGKDVLVLEKGKVIGKKTCAAGITLKDFQFGIPKKLMERSFKRIILHTPKQDVVVKQDEPFVYTTSRPTLGAFLAKRAKKAGAVIQTQSEVTNIMKDSITTRSGEKINFDYLIGDDGSASVVRKAVGLPVLDSHQAYQYIAPKTFKDLEIFVDANKFGSAYGWVFPYTKTSSIGSGCDLAKSAQTNYPASKLRRNFLDWFEDNYSFDKSEIEFQAHRITYGYKGHEFGNKFLIGDAAGFSSSITGEGIYQSMLSGLEVAKKIIDSNYTCPHIKRLLWIKRKEDKILHWLEKKSWLTNLLFETGAFLSRSRFISDRMLDKINNY